MYCLFLITRQSEWRRKGQFSDLGKVTRQGENLRKCQTSVLGRNSSYRCLCCPTAGNNQAVKLWTFKSEKEIFKGRWRTWNQVHASNFVIEFQCQYLDVTSSREGQWSLLRMVDSTWPSVASGSWVRLKQESLLSELRDLWSRLPLPPVAEKTYFTRYCTY